MWRVKETGVKFLVCLLKHGQIKMIMNLKKSCLELFQIQPD